METLDEYFARTDTPMPRSPVGLTMRAMLETDPTLDFEFARRGAREFPDNARRALAWLKTPEGAEAGRAFQLLTPAQRCDIDPTAAKVTDATPDPVPQARGSDPVDRRCICGASLAGKRQDAKWCSDTCRMRLGRQNKPKTHIENKGFADAKIESLLPPYPEPLSSR
jgi:hypothetical protein